MNVTEVVTKAIYDVLNADTAIQAIVTSGGISRIWVGAAPPQLVSAFPYILITYASGGVLNDAPYNAANITYMISGVDKTAPNAKLLDGLIGDNFRQKEITYSDGWVSWATVRQLDAFNRVENVQNAQYWQYGNYYKFRLAKGL